MQVVMMNMLWGMLACCINVPSAVGDVHPSSFTLVGEHEVGAVIPSQPSPHFVRNVMHLVGRLLVNPVGHRAL